MATHTDFEDIHLDLPNAGNASFGNEHNSGRDNEGYLSEHQDSLGYPPHEQFNYSHTLAGNTQDLDANENDIGYQYRNESFESETEVEFSDDRIVGAVNEAYDGDAETDASQVYSGSWDVSIVDTTGKTAMEWPPFQFVPGSSVERSGSGRYIKNPSLERKKDGPPRPPFDPQTGLYITPPSRPIISEVPFPTKTKVRKRIPRPPSKLRFRCAYLWSTITCLLGPFFCAIPAFRYTITAKESSKIGDYNSANSYLRRVLILCVVGLAVAAAGWIVLILYLTNHLGNARKY